MNKQKSIEILSILKEIIPNPVCELNFHNNFELLCAVMLSAQTTDKRVNQITPSLFSKYPDCQSLKNASYDEVLAIVKPLGLAQTKAKNLILLAEKLDEDFNGVVPDKLEELEKLPGVGRKTASVILAVGYNIPAMPVDTHIHRVSMRLGYVKKNASVLDCEKNLKRYIPESDWIDAHHLLLLFGRYHCKAMNPNCNTCKLKEYCKYKSH